MYGDTVLFQQAIGHIVARIYHHLAGRNGQGVAGVAPLFPGRVNGIAAAAGDQLYLVQL